MSALSKIINSKAKKLMYPSANNTQISVGIYEITPAIAAEILEHNHEMNRKVGKSNLLVLEKSMKDGDFQSLNGQQIVICIDSKGIVSLTDGQHRMNALINSGKTYHFQIAFIFNAVSDKILQGIDVGKKRTPADMFRTTGRLSKLHTSVLVGIGYDVSIRRVEHVLATTADMFKAYDANPDMIEVYKNTNKTIRDSTHSSISNKVLVFDKSIYFALYMISSNFGNIGAAFVEHLAAVEGDEQPQVTVKLSATQKSIITRLQKLFNGRDKNFEKTLMRAYAEFDLDPCFSDTRIKRSRKSVFLCHVFMSFFKPNKTGFTDKHIKKMLTNEALYRKWPALGKFKKD